MMKLQQTAKDPKELLELDKLKLQQIIEEEHELLRSALNREMKQLDKRGDGEMALFKGRETCENQRQLQLRVLEKEKQKVKQQRLLEKLAKVDAKSLVYEEVAVRKRQHVKDLEEEVKKQKAASQLIVMERELVVKKSVTKTVER